MYINFTMKKYYEGQVVYTIDQLNRLKMGSISLTASLIHKKACFLVNSYTFLLLVERRLFYDPFSSIQGFFMQGSRNGRIGRAVTRGDSVRCTPEHLCCLLQRTLMIYHLTHYLHSSLTSYSPSNTQPFVSVS